MALQHILFDLNLFPNEAERASSQKRVLWLLQALMNCDRLYLREHPETPLIYQSGIKYKVPEQFEQANLPEVAAVRAYLRKKGAPGDVTDAFNTLADQVGAGEHFREIPRILENGGGDCFPRTTRVLKRDGSTVPVADLRIGDEIWGRHRWSKVQAAWSKGTLPVLRFHLESVHQGTWVERIERQRHFEVTADHKVFVVSEGGAVIRVKADEVFPGMSLIAPRRLREETSRDAAPGEFEFTRFDDGWDLRRVVSSIERRPEVEVMDLTTDDHYVYLPDAEVTVSQCDNLAPWRAAELCELGIPAQPYITWRFRPDGGTTYHVVVLWPDGTHEDPSLLLGMGGAARDPDRLEEHRKLGERCADLVSGNLETIFGARGRRRATILGHVRDPDDGDYVFGTSPVLNAAQSAGGSVPTTTGPFALQYTIPFQTDDSYEDWSPTRPQAFYANPLYPGGLVSQSGPLFNTLLRDEDYDFEDRFDGLTATPGRKREWARRLRRARRRAA